MGGANAFDSRFFICRGGRQRNRQRDGRDGHVGQCDMEAQVDFRIGRFVVDAHGKRRKVLTAAPLEAALGGLDVGMRRRHAHADRRTDDPA